VGEGKWDSNKDEKSKEGGEKLCAERRKEKKADLYCKLISNRKDKRKPGGTKKIPGEKKKKVPGGSSLRKTSRGRKRKG